MIGGVEGNGFCSSLLAYTAATQNDRQKWKNDFESKGSNAIFVDFILNSDYMEFLMEYVSSDTRIVPQVIAILTRQIRKLKEDVYSASPIKKWTKLLKAKKSNTLYKGTGQRPTIPREGKNFVPYWLAIEDFCGDGHEEGAFYSRVHIILWAQLMFPRDKEDYSAVSNICLTNLMSKPFDMYLFCDNRPRRKQSNSRWLFQDLINILEHSTDYSSTNAFFGGSHFNLLINDPRDDLLKVNDDKKKRRTFERLFEKLVSRIWNVFKKYHIDKVDFICSSSPPSSSSEDEGQ